MSLVTTNGARFYLKSGESLLEGLERTGHTIEYQCREGYCGSCRIRVEGVCRYVRSPLAYTTADEVLVCCAIPKTDVYLDIDLHKTCDKD